ncbi:DUF5689 domain-containing protein [Flagellimonas aequoris]|uniref:Lamin tail domain-containing protein n=1 Tax=Flagellimonas aequoris TaxID=2306997 RepID=A0A418N7H9_9FLAO|nr:DUF5689 domain-containing protein [Allomuricauda aequoris]RIV70780.1 lamin tail domain-containing protein [Allomuricauda aequoris]TXK02219.1 lamin tail domain-containing protein [Allomuricauda aequoris]
MKNLVFAIVGILLLLMFSCVESSDFDAPKENCNTDLKANINFVELDSLSTEEVTQIKDSLILEGYVISSDKAGNFFSTLFIQDKPSKPTYGLQLEVDIRQSHLVYPEGGKVFLKLKDLYMVNKEGNIRLGSAFSSFGSLSIGRLPNQKVFEHVWVACDGKENVEPLLTTISALDTLPLNILVQLVDLEVVDDELGEPFAVATEETERHLQDCEENQTVLLNSGYADFQSEILPDGNGSITGILVRDGKNPQLIIRSLEDIDFTNDRCPEIITEFTSNQIFISELADPDNNSGARFVELYNSSSEPLDLNKWTLRRYTNDGTEVSSTIDLSGLIIGAESTLVISPNAEEFQLVYGFAPDLGVSTNSPADSNGDDNLELVDPFGTIIDVFGVVGEDGSNTNHEFEDGRAVRNSNIIEGSPIYTFSEWTLFNDTGDAGTIKLPQNAPQDFTPGLRD